MSSSGDSEAEGTSGVLRVQIVYNGEVLDIALDSLKAYKEGTQSLTYLDSSVHLAYALLKLLEKHAKQESGGELVRQKRKRARRKKNDDTTIPDVEEDIDQEQEEEVTETMFTFDAFEQVCIASPFCPPHAPI